MNDSNIAICKFCGKEFIKKHSKHCFCCVNCRRKYNYANRKYETYTCSECHKEYMTQNKSKSENNFCSKECELKYKYGLSHKYFKCETCEKEMLIRNGDNRRFCSIECQSK